MLWSRALWASTMLTLPCRSPQSTWPASSLCRWGLLQLQFFLISQSSELLGLPRGREPKILKLSPVVLLPCWLLPSTPSSPTLVLSLLLPLRTLPSRIWSLGRSRSLPSRSLERWLCLTTTLTRTPTTRPHLKRTARRTSWSMTVGPLCPPMRKLSSLNDYEFCACVLDALKYNLMT